MGAAALPGARARMPTYSCANPKCAKNPEGFAVFSPDHRNLRTALLGLAPEALGNFELTFRLFQTTQLLEDLAEHVVSRLVIGIKLNGTTEHLLGGRGLVLLHVRLTKQDVRTAIVGVDPERPLQCCYRFGPFQLAPKGIP